MRLIIIKKKHLSITVRTNIKLLAGVTLVLVSEVLVDGLPQLVQPECLLRSGLSVDGVRPLWCVDLYGVLITCTHTHTHTGIDYHRVLQLQA